MRHRNRADASSLFLLELILAILFFSIASAVCVQFFVKSHILSQNARELNTAAREVSNLTELITASGDTASAIGSISSQYPDSVSDGTRKVTIYYNGRLTPCKKKEARYRLSALFQQKGTMLSAKLQMNRMKDGGIIYSLDLSHHLQRRNTNGI